jgi:hypothetical protein
MSVSQTLALWLRGWRVNIYIIDSSSDNNNDDDDNKNNNNNNNENNNNDNNDNNSDWYDSHYVTVMIKDDAYGWIEGTIEAISTKQYPSDLL